MEPHVKDSAAERPLFFAHTAGGRRVELVTRRGGVCVVMVDGLVLHESGDGSLSAVKMAVDAFAKAAKSS